MSDIAPEKRDEIIATLQEVLDTRDKRFMFLKITFPQFLPYINLEGSPAETSWNIYTHFKNNNMRGSLIAAINSIFDKELSL